MDCPHPKWTSDREFMAALARKVAERRIPIAGTFDLTYRCNLSCVHCYLKDVSPTAKAEQELDTRAVLALLDEIAAAGCLYLLFSGGDPWLRKDFELIYRYAKEKGFLITIFTNGVLLNDSLLALLTEFPPQTVEISIYGASATVHDRIVGVPGTFALSLANIKKMLAAKIRVKLKTVLMKLNNHELGAMERLALTLGTPFRLDSDLFPRLNDRGCRPVALRVAPEEAVRQEMADPNRRRQWRDYYQKHQDSSISDTLYACGAGLNNFYLDPYGSVSPCLMSTRYRYSLKQSSFIERWQNEIARFQEQKPGPAYPCNACTLRLVCTACPGLFDLENNSEEKPSSYLCAKAAIRQRIIVSSDDDLLL